jgi:4,5-DOPA dioxygenase extradiol
MMPAIFIGHGSPMNAVEDNEFTKEWKEIAVSVPKPVAIVCISAHWTTKGSHVTAMTDPRTIHDFYGFPETLYQQNYPAPGSPEIASEIMALVKGTEIKPDLYTWGLDHGAWSILSQMYPAADIPVVQLSLDLYKSPEQHFQLAQELTSLREKNILILCSGNIVHNLQMIKWSASGIADEGYEWADTFDHWVKSCLQDNETEKLLNYRKMGSPAELAIPSPEHFIPLFYLLGVRLQNDKCHFYGEKVIGGSLSMRSVVLK